MIAVLPAMLVSVFIYELGPILSFCGVFSLVLVGISIPAVCLAAQRLIPTKSEFDFRYNYQIAVGLICTSTLILIGMFISFIFKYYNDF